mmetsp:Transcript_8100/g.26060  ORF Transcript_8100/g.26060 Transcript_8100/m.26060 type:complete len:255 (-) Transcript_8100:1052-1816(-)|eukprot:scaffold795_cov115-Isochrysis_galbana.AAC.5
MREQPHQPPRPPWRGLRRVKSRVRVRQAATVVESTRPQPGASSFRRRPPAAAQAAEWTEAQPRAMTEARRRANCRRHLRRARTIPPSRRCRAGLPRPKLSPRGSRLETVQPACLAVQRRVRVTRQLLLPPRRRAMCRDGYGTGANWSGERQSHPRPPLARDGRPGTPAPPPPPLLPALPWVPPRQPNPVRVAQPPCQHPADAALWAGDRREGERPGTRAALVRKAQLRTDPHMHRLSPLRRGVRTWPRMSKRAW